MTRTGILDGRMVGHGLDRARTFRETLKATRGNIDRTCCYERHGFSVFQDPPARTSKNHIRGNTGKEKE